MKKINKYASGILAAVALTLFSMSSQAQTTNFMVYNFDTDQVFGVWGNFFGGYFQSALWDSTMDASNNPDSGSMQIMLTCTGSDQYVAWDNIAPGYSADITTTFTNLSFDIRYDISSAIRTNTSTAGNNGSTGVGSLDYGFMRVGASKNYDQDWYYYLRFRPPTGWASQTRIGHTSASPSVYRRCPANWRKLRTSCLVWMAPTMATVRWWAIKLTGSITSNLSDRAAVSCLLHRKWGF